MPEINTATIHQLPLKTRLVCSRCGVEAACDCGVAYVPAGLRAAEAIAANPEKSDRALADELGIGKDTLRRARPSGGAHAPTQKRVGKDGKMYPVERKPRKPRAEYRAERFDAAMEAIQHYCENVVEMEIPRLTPESTRRATERLSAGQRELQTLKTRIKGPQAAAQVPLNRQVNALLGNLGHAVDDAHDALGAFAVAHPELDGEGRKAVQDWLRTSARQLLTLAREFDGR